VRRSYQPYWYHATGYNEQLENYDLTLLNEEEGTEYLNYNPGDKIVTSSFYFQSRLNYDSTFAAKHDVGGLLVFTARNEVTGNANDLQSSLARRNLNLAG